MKFSQPIWMIGVGNIIGLVSLIVGLALVFTGVVSPGWLVPWVLSHAVTSLMVTVGLHRYWSHRAFETTPFWHQFMNFYSVIILLGSPLAWATAHITHHVKSDTDQDPHYTGWDYIFWKRYNHVPMVRGRMKRLITDRWVVFTHRYGMLLWIAFVLVLLAISWKVLLFGYLMGMGSVQLIGALHQVLSHKDGKPRDLAVLEYILPAFGEWMHETHHGHGGWKDMRTKPWHMDLGYQFIKLIETEKSARRTR